MRYLALALLCASRVAAAQSAEPNTWHYEATIDGSPWSVTMWEGGTDVFAGAPGFLVETVTISPDGDKRIDERTYLQKTPSGIVTLGARTADEVGGATTIEERVAVTPPVALPAPLDLGAKWDATTNLRVATTHAGGVPAASTVTLHVVGDANGREAVTVPAGNFDCIVVHDTTTTQTTDNGATTEQVAATTSWYAAKVGLVKATTTTTITTTRGADTSKRETTRTLQLRAYRVPRSPWQMSSVGLVPAGEPAPSEAQPAAPAPETTPTPAPAPAITAPPPAPADDSAERHRRLGRRLTIAGGVIVAAGLGLGVAASSQWNMAQNDCGGNINNCTASQLDQAKTDTDAARSFANFATGFVIVGAALAATGIYVWASTPDETAPSVQVQPSVTSTAATITLSGRW